MKNIIIAAVLLIILGAAVWYVIKAKKSGKTCIGCSGGCCMACKGHDNTEKDENNREVL